MGAANYIRAGSLKLQFDTVKFLEAEDGEIAYYISKHE